MLNNQGKLTHPSFHKWSTTNADIKKAVGSSFTTRPMTYADHRLNELILSKGGKMYSVVLIGQGTNKAVVTGTIADVNIVIIDRTDPAMNRSAFIALIELLLKQSSVNEQQIYNALKRIRHHSTDLSQAVSYVMINRAVKWVESFCKLIRLPKSSLIVIHNSDLKAITQADLTVVHKDYINKQLLQKDVKLIRDQRFTTTTARKAVIRAIINQRIKQKLVFPVNVASSPITLIDNGKKAVNVLLDQFKPTAIVNITWDSSLSIATIILSNRATITIDNNVLIVSTSGRHNVSLNVLKTVIPRSKDVRGVLTYKDDVEAYKTILGGLYTKLKQGSITVGNRPYTIDQVGKLFMELEQHEQQQASKAIDMIVALIDSVIDNQSIMWEYIINLPLSDKQPMYIQG